jgi:hypothetical protein
MGLVSILTWLLRLEWRWVWMSHDLELHAYLDLFCWPKNEIPKRARPHPDPGLDSSVLSMYAVSSIHSGKKVYARAHTCAGTFDRRRTGVQG